MSTRLGWTLLVGSITLSAAAFHATPVARNPRPALVHTLPTAARYAPPARRVVMNFGETVELFGGIAAVLAVVAITQDDGGAVESQRATEAGETAAPEAAESPALARAEQALAEAEQEEQKTAREAEVREAEAKEVAQAIQQAASLAAAFYSEGAQSRIEALVRVS